MRIQHNIMAMNAYRNYTGNVNAMKSNLEKLSSGYKINRAGDDAAGLAISEKMRAQITGLNAAQKNVKDGISLVQTAEGAMQEVQDMLNRMVYLATQSANGTYDNEVDRNNLQKELNQLRSEIDRISDSANFNGIKLLDGSKDATATGVGAADATAGTVSSIVTSTVGSTLGTSTILHSSGVEAAETEFGVDLHELTFSNKTGETLTLKIGTNEFTLAGGAHGTAGTALDAAGIAAAFAAGKFEDSTGTAVAANAVSITDGTNTDTFTATADGTRITFKQNAAPTAADKVVKGDMAVTIESEGTAAVKAGWTTGAYNAGTLGGADTFDTNQSSAAIVLTIDGAEKTFNAANIDGDATIDDLVTAIGNAADGTNTISDYYDVAKDGTKVKLTLKDTLPTGTTSSVVKSFTFTAAASTGTDAGTAAPTMTAGSAVTAAAAGETPVSGDYNTTTTVTKQGVAEGASRIASGVATVTKDFFAEGNIIKVGDKEYAVSTDAADKDSTTKVYVGDLDLTNAADLNTAIDRLSVVADSNSVWTIGHGTTAGEITFVEKVADDGKSYTEQNTTGGKLADDAFDLSKESVIKETFGTVTGRKEASAGVDGKALTFQIGDTAEEYNQLKVSIGDIHTKALGIDGISIAKQEDAAKAVQKIKDAINTVSGIRGDLGATQNRLEHTANNLSVMQENITDAESSIRDTDVAEEMMAYTKNNILIQAAQAMLAQANQVPQGVLQLLQ